MATTYEDRFGNATPSGSVITSPLVGTSTSTASVSTGSQTFSVQQGRAWKEGTRLRISSTNVGMVMEGNVTSYAGATSVTINVDLAVTGSGGSTDSWNLGVAGALGSTAAGNLINQNSSAISITGGSISGVSINSSAFTSSGVTITGGSVSGVNLNSSALTSSNATLTGGAVSGMSVNSSALSSSNATLTGGSVSGMSVNSSALSSSAPTFTGVIDISSTNAGQIKFPATQNPSADPNTFDDYEEGTWTPSLGGNTTYTSNVGVYTKIGRLVNINFDTRVNSIGTGSATTVSNVPFLANATVGGAIPIFFTSALVTNVVFICGNVGAGAATVTFQTMTAAAGGTTGGANLFQNSTIVIGGGTYAI